jgi:hypothetical protein
VPEPQVENSAVGPVHVERQQDDGQDYQRWVVPQTLNTIQARSVGFPPAVAHADKIPRAWAAA